MSAIVSLTNAYGSFFHTAIDVAVLPYTTTYQAYDDPDKGTEACIWLTLVPVLPILSVATIKMASTAAVIGLATMPFTYPAAVVYDAIQQNCFNSEEEEDQSAENHHRRGLNG